VDTKESFMCGSITDLPLSICCKSNCKTLGTSGDGCLQTCDRSI